ncbi:MAG: T9SS type A sorting domain-containing protein, partial [candidate division Zixibacteria bacterium]|nr:T9SS type A sorting domain-containing protein [candidate division Zixibacteria bacterium]
FSVTAFDYGDFQKRVDPLESKPGRNAVFGFPIYSSDVVVDSGLRVSVYPNPYKSYFLDPSGHRTSYFGQGYEAPGMPETTDRDRRIWFINLPDTATIRIYSLDGDLIRTINHPDKFLTRYSSCVGWDLISRNTQAVESGIYIYRVDSRLGTQIGKIVIIK